MSYNGYNHQAAAPYAPQHPQIMLNGYYYTPVPKQNSRSSREDDDGCCNIYFLRYVIFVYNSIFWLTGGGLIAVSLWIILDKYSVFHLMTSYLYVGLILCMLGCGVLIILNGILGYCGALQNSWPSLCCYSFLLLCIFFVEITMGIAGYMTYSRIEMPYAHVFQPYLSQNLTASLNSVLTTYYGFDLDRTISVDWMQTQYRCCGAASFHDWSGSRWWQRRNASMTAALGGRAFSLAVPDSCCITHMKNCGQNTSPTNIWIRGCREILDAHIRGDLFIIGAVGLGLCILQIIGVSFTCCLMSAIRLYKKRLPRHIVA